MTRDAARQYRIQEVQWHRAIVENMEGGALDGAEQVAVQVIDDIWSFLSSPVRGQGATHFEELHCSIA